MKTETTHVVGYVSAKPRAVYEAWIDGGEHGTMTGAAATSEPREGGRFTAWDGYIEGTHRELRAPKRIVQSWRTSEFPAKAPDSRLIVLLEPEGDGTRVTIVHTDIPEGQGARYESGWKTHYLEPMKRHFAKAGRKVTRAAAKRSGKK